LRKSILRREKPIFYYELYQNKNVYLRSSTKKRDFIDASHLNPDELSAYRDTHKDLEEQTAKKTKFTIENKWT
jgi:hypothetical protein